MDFYYEQSVSGKQSRFRTVLYVLSWVLIVLLLISAMAFGANVFGTDPSAFVVSWKHALGLALCLAAAAALFSGKDRLRIEYDYILRGSTLEIHGILNRRRRKQLARIDLLHIQACGLAASRRCKTLMGARDIRVHRWNVLPGGYYLYYIEENVRHLAVLGLDDQLASLICRQLPVGVWQGIEGV